ncbi:hypothetical protein ACFLYR_06190 [Chloroflexota bacterium]
MDEAEKLADRVGIIDHGRIIIEGTPGELIEQMGADTVRISGQGAIAPFLEKVKGLSFVQEVKIAEGVIHVAVDSGNRRLTELVSLATGNDFTIEDTSVASDSASKLMPIAASTM